MPLSPWERGRARALFLRSCPPIGYNTGHQMLVWASKVILALRVEAHPHVEAGGLLSRGAV